MARPRQELQDLLKSVLGSDNVYFQPPATVQMVYPAIIYSRNYADSKFAGNSPYRYTKRYSVTVVDRDPDSPIPDQIAKLPLCTYERWYAADDLNHDVFNIFF